MRVSRDENEGKLLNHTFQKSAYLLVWRPYLAFPFCPFSSFDFFNDVYVRCSMFHCAQTFECTFLLFGQSPITLCYKMGFDYVISYVIIMRNKSFLYSVAAMQWKRDADWRCWFHKDSRRVLIKLVTVKSNNNNLIYPLTSTKKIIFPAISKLSYR